MEPSRQFDSLFHGTNAPISTGGVVLPRAATGESTSPNFDDERLIAQGWNSPEHAFATNSPELAAWYAKNRAREMGGDPRVFRVEPINSEDVEHDPDGGGDKGHEAFKSRSGFRVLGEVEGLDLSDDKDDKK